MKKGMILFIGLALVLGMATAQASMKEMKVYKEAFPDAKIKCIDCHADAMLKKDAGKHELNAYGKAVVKSEATVDMYKKLGTVEAFKKK